MGYRVRLRQDQSVGQMWVIGHGLELELGQMLELEVGQMWVIGSGWVKVSSVRSWTVPTERLDMYLSGSCGSGKTRKIGEFS